MYGVHVKLFVHLLHRNWISVGQVNGFVEFLSFAEPVSSLKVVWVW